MIEFMSEIIDLKVYGKSRVELSKPLGCGFCMYKLKPLRLKASKITRFSRKKGKK